MKSINMTPEQVMKIVVEAIEDVFMVDSSKITKETVAIDIAGWDSLSHTILLSNIEDELDQNLELDELEFNNVGDLIDFIYNQINKPE